MTPRRLLIVGTGPAGLMAASIAADAGIQVTILEKRRAIGRKLLIAGSSGLNITNSLPLKEFARAYSGSALSGFWSDTLTRFSPQDWIEFIEKRLGQETFLGTSARYFVREMKASKMLQTWVQGLENRGVQFRRETECTEFGTGFVTTAGGERLSADAVLLTLGGGSYEPDESPLRWLSIFARHQIPVLPFQASNVGHHVAWSAGLLAEAEGKPLKNCVLTTPRGSKRGEMVITRYGLEGTPVYTVGAVGEATLNLLPERDPRELKERCLKLKENLSPIRRIKKQLGLSEAALALVFHETPRALLQDLDALLARLQRFPITFTGTQPLTEAISSSGGVPFSEVHTHSLELQKVPGVYCAGEMLDWDAPTGGFLIQGCVSTGALAGRAIVAALGNVPSR